MAPICADGVAASASSSTRANSHSAQQQQQQQQMGGGRNNRMREAGAHNNRARGEEAKGRVAATAALNQVPTPTSTSRAVNSKRAEAADAKSAVPEEEQENEGEGKRKGQEEEKGENPREERLEEKRSTCKRVRLRERRRSRLKKLSPRYVSDASELFFLQVKAGDQMDFLRDFSAFRKRPPAKFLTFLQSRRCPASVIEEMRDIVAPPSPSSSSSSSSSSPAPPRTSSTASEHTPTLAERLSSPVTPARPLPALKQAPPPQLPSPLRQPESSSTLPTKKRKTALRTSSSHDPDPSPSMVALRALNSDLPWSGLNSPRVPDRTREMLADRMKQEAWVIRRVHELSREGMWTPRRIPKV